MNPGVLGGGVTMIVMSVMWAEERTEKIVDQTKKIQDLECDLAAARKEIRKNYRASVTG